MPFFHFAASFISINTNALHLWGYYTINLDEIYALFSLCRIFYFDKHKCLAFVGLLYHKFR